MAPLQPKNNILCFDVLDIPIHVTHMMHSIHLIDYWLSIHSKQYICVRDIHGIICSYWDKQLKHIHQNSGLVVPDGMPLVWCGKLKGYRDIGRVYGPDLMWKLCGHSIKAGYSHFLYGGRVGVAQTLKQTLEFNFPGIQIKGAITPPFRELTQSEEDQLIHTINKIKPDIFWVGLSTPKQELFMHRFYQKLDTTIMLGVGGAFDIHTGRTKDAPLWIKKLGMQWFFRMIQEPDRLIKRYMTVIPLFILLYGCQVVRMWLFKETQKLQSTSSNFR